MPGLLSTGNSSGGLLTGLLAPQGNLGATAEAMRRQREREAAMRAQQQAEAQAAAARAAPPQRGRVNPLRVFDGIFSSDGDGTFSGSLDRERRRLEAEAQRPQAMARMEQLRTAAQQMGPAAMIAFETNPEAFGAQLAEQYAPRTTAAGGRTDILGTGQGVAAPSFSTVNDTIFRNNPVGGTSEAVATAPAAFSDVTARYNAENPTVPANSRVVNLPTGRVVAEGYVAPEVVSTPAGGTTNVFDAQGNVINSVQGNAKPLTAMDRRQLREDQDAVRTAEEITTNLDNLIGQIERNELNLGPVTNMISGARNAAGVSDQNSRNFASFRASLEKLRNDSLRLNTGVQTDGDSRRAWDELVANINDERVVAQRLREIADINRRAIEYRQARIADAEQAVPGAQAPAGGRMTPEQAVQLPSGTRFIGMDGVERVRR